MEGRKWIALGIVAALIVVAVGVAAYSNNVAAQTTVNEQGSDTMLQLMTIIAEGFNNQSNSCQVQVAGGGSGVGITALINRQIDVAQASREMKDSEKQQAKANGVDPVEFSVAIDGLAIIVNHQNKVDNITIEQIRGIYNGTITNWNQINSSLPSMTINAFGRQSTSGTFEFMREHVLKGGNFSQSVSQETGNAQIASKVQQAAGGIGYVGIGYAREASGTGGQAKILSVRNNTSAPAYEPTDVDAVYNGTYPLWRYLFLYTNGQPTGCVKDWISFVLSSDGQALTEKVGFYALSPEMHTAMSNKLNGTTGSSSAPA